MTMQHGLVLFGFLSIAILIIGNVISKLINIFKKPRFKIRIVLGHPKEK